jgi:hypothetical protein
MQNQASKLKSQNNNDIKLNFPQSTCYGEPMIRERGDLCGGVVAEINNKTVVVFSIQEYPIKPVATRGKYFKRTANSNQILSNRKNIVQNNLGLFNDLYAQLTEILNIGKILYKATEAVKTQEHTFSTLLKQVRIVAKKEAAATPEVVTTQA